MLKIKSTLTGEGPGSADPTTENVSALWNLKEETYSCQDGVSLRLRRVIHQMEFMWWKHVSPSRERLKAV